MGAFTKNWRNIYIYCTSIKNYLLNLLGNSEIADIISSHITQLTSLLSEPTCRLLEHIKTDFNFVEVCDGFCFDIEEKKFSRNPKRLKGSPRAYVHKVLARPYLMMFYVIFPHPTEFPN